MYYLFFSISSRATLNENLTTENISTLLEHPKWDQTSKVNNLKRPQKNSDHFKFFWLRVRNNTEITIWPFIPLFIVNYSFSQSRKKGPSC